MPTSGRRHQSQSSYYESVSPPSAIQEQEEQRSSSATPNSGSGGKVTPSSPTAKVTTGHPTGYQTVQTGLTSKPSLSGSELGSPPPLPPFYSPEGSIVQPVQSGPYLDPPVEFSSQNTPTSSRQAMSPVRTKPQPPVNGGVRHQQIDVSATTTTVQHVKQERERSPFDIDQPVFLANSNGNNNNANGRGVPVLTEVRSVSTGMVNHHSVSSPNSRGLQSEDNFPSHSSILTRSDNAEIRSSMESGFDADNELDNTTAWYLSPDSSPKQGDRDPRPKLGPRVVAVSSQGSQNYRPCHKSADEPLTHFQQYSGTASDMHSLGSQKSRENSISGYNHSLHDRARQQMVSTPLHENHLYNGARRGSVPGVLEQPQNTTDIVYSEIYPTHKVSRSFDSAEMLNDRVQNGSRSTKVRFASPPPPCLLYTSPSPRDATLSRMPSSA